MSRVRFITGAGVLAIGLAVATSSALLAQAKPGQDSASHRTWGVIPGPGGATTPASAATTPRTDALADTAFIREAMSGNAMEVRLGDLAMSRASNPAVRQFAQRMITDHGTMQKQWSALVSRNALPVRASLTAAQEQSAKQLERLSGAAFDRGYMTSMVQDHQNDATAFQREAASARSAEVRQLAASGLTTIQQHLTLAQQVASQVGATGVVATVPPTQGGPPIPGTNPGTRTTNPSVPSTAGQPSNPSNPAASQRDRDNDNKNVKADRDFVQETVADHITEVRMAQLAERKAKSGEVKRLAEQMVADLSKWKDRWNNVAARNDLNVSAGLGHDHQKKVDKVDKASKKDFDRVYVSTVADHLESIVPYFQNEGQSARSAEVRRLVNDELPVIREHLATARRLGGGSGERAEASEHEHERKLSSEK